MDTRSPWVYARFVDAIFHPDLLLNLTLSFFFPSDNRSALEFPSPNTVVHFWFWFQLYLLKEYSGVFSWAIQAIIVLLSWKCLYDLFQRSSLSMVIRRAMSLESGI